MLREVMEGRGVIARAKGLRHVLPAPLLASMLGHGLVVAAVAFGLPWRGVEDQPAGPTLISVDMIFPVAAPSAVGPEPEPISSPPPLTLKTKSMPSGAVGDAAASEEIWRPLDPRVERARDLQQLMNLAACPRFDEPAARAHETAMDPDLVEKCARSLEGMRAGPGAERVAAKAARRQERLALDLGWAVAVVPKLDPDAPEAQTSPHKTYADEVFGPWPWDAARKGGG
jgi:hypothetical protein